MIKLPQRNTPRWVIFLIDIGICLVSLSIAYFLRFDFIDGSNFLLELEWEPLKWAIPVFIAIRALTFYFGKTYEGIIRFTSTADARRLFLTITAGSLIFALISPIRYSFVDGYYFLPRPIIILDYLITLFLMITSRFVIKLLYIEQSRRGKPLRKVIIYGAGELGLVLKQVLERDNAHRNSLYSYVDDDKKKVGKRLEGTPIASTDELEKILAKGEIDTLILGILKPDLDNKKKVVDLCIKYGVETLSVPPAESWINGEFRAGQMRKVRIEELLGRKEIKLNRQRIEADVKGKNVLVSGAAGSIGSEIAKQLLFFEPEKLILVDQSETGLYDVHNELKNLPNSDKLEVVVGDVSNETRMRNVFSTYKPQLVFHAAAYKHVPLMEDNPSEAIRTNVAGSKLLADLANEFQVAKFVMISTDKAVNPTNVMGASKRIAEIYCQSLNKQSSTQYVTTRFGNVLGSNGSVIPLFRKQIEQGGPVTVTHEAVTRYFMTIPEACQLVLEAGAMGEGGEIFVFDMGESVKIIDLAKKMIRLSGLTVGEDIEIKITGLRPGEKLYEELLTSDENTLPTHHPQIMIGKVREYPFQDIQRQITKLIDSYGAQNNTQIVTMMKEMVPEFKSNNSEFAELDN